MWDTRTLQEICEKITDGTHQTPKYFDEGYIFLSSKNVKTGKIDWSDVKFIDGQQHEAMQSRLSPKKGDILLAKNGTTGVAAIVDRGDVEFDIYVSLALLRCKATAIPEYVLYFINSRLAKEQFNKRLKGVGVPNLHLKEIREVHIPLAPLPEQKRIVAILDEAFEGIDAAIANTQANVAAIRKLFERFVTTTAFAPTNMKECEIVEVSELAKPTKGSIRTGPFGSQLLHSEFVSNGVSVLGIDNAVSNQFEWRKKRFITLEKYEELKRYTVHPGDVLITIMGTCGRCAVVPDDIPVAINTKHLCCITLDHTKCLPSYLHLYFLHHPKAKEYLLRNAKGTVMDGLNMGIIKSLPVQLPKIEKQHLIVAAIREFQGTTEALSKIYENKLDALHELKQSILAKAFRGELTQEEIAA